MFSAARLPGLPEVPTVAESGHDVVVTKFRGLMGPPGTPPDIVSAWEDAVRNLLEDPEYRAVYTGAMLSTAYMPRAEFAVFIEAFAADTETFLRESGVID